LVLLCGTISFLYNPGGRVSVASRSPLGRFFSSPLAEMIRFLFFSLPYSFSRSIFFFFRSLAFDFIVGGFASLSWSFWFEVFFHRGFGFFFLVPLFLSGAQGGPPVGCAPNFLFPPATFFGTPFRDFPPPFLPYQH